MTKKKKLEKKIEAYLVSKKRSIDHGGGSRLKRSFKKVAKMGKRNTPASTLHRKLPQGKVVDQKRRPKAGAGEGLNTMGGVHERHRMIEGPAAVPREKKVEEATKREKNMGGRGGEGKVGANKRKVVFGKKIKKRNKTNKSNHPEVSRKKKTF